MGNDRNFLYWPTVPRKLDLYIQALKVLLLMEMIMILASWGWRSTDDDFGDGDDDDDADDWSHSLPVVGSRQVMWCDVMWGDVGQWQLLCFSVYTLFTHSSIPRSWSGWAWRSWWSSWTWRRLELWRWLWEKTLALHNNEANSASLDREKARPRTASQVPRANEVTEYFMTGLVSR